MSFSLFIEDLLFLRPSIVAKWRGLRELVLLRALQRVDELLGEVPAVCGGSDERGRKPSSASPFASTLAKRHGDVH